MPGIGKFLHAVFIALLTTGFVIGCAQKSYAQNIDCRICHVPPDLAAGAKDFSAIYARPTAHHAVGVRYPSGIDANPNYHQPDGQGANMVFFDSNGNGQPDDDEIVLFGVNNAVTIECASCHKEHGDPPAPPNTPANHYLRVNNAGSALCSICHIH